MCKRLSSEAQSSIKHFYNAYPHVMYNPLINSFLDNEEHYSLFIKSLCNTSKENNKALDKAFREFYTGVKIINYLSKTLYWEGVNFDRKIRTRNLRHLLIFDGTSSDNEESLSLNTTIPIEKESMEEQIIENYNVPLIERLENYRLKSAFLKLTERQKEILQCVYGSNKSITETASELNITQQGVSKIHKLAIERLKKEMNVQERG